MDQNTFGKSREPGLGKVIRDNLRQKDFRRTLRRDYEELKELFIDDDRKKRLEEMRPLKRWLFTAGWLLKALIRKLTPARRLMLVVAFILVLFANNLEYNGEKIHVQIDMGAAAGAIVLFVLMLELKDKLLARDELEAGRAVQLALLPERSPKVPGWSVWLFTRTANEVGGDLVDFQKMAVDRFRVTLADVAGKGLSAALLTAKLQATLRAIAPDSDSLGEVGSKLNRIFYRDSLRNVFASVVYLEMQSEKGELRFINAGHQPPLLLRGTAIEEMPKGDAAIGILPEAIPTEHRIDLRKGEMLLVYSDGLSDAKNMEGEFFGTQRLLKLLPALKDLGAPEAGEGIVAEVDRFVGDARVYDDLSLIVLKRLV